MVIIMQISYAEISKICFKRAGNVQSLIFVQDNCPILNCAHARKALKEVGGELFPILKEDVFNVAKEDLEPQEDLKTQAKVLRTLQEE